MELQVSRRLARVLVADECGGGDDSAGVDRDGYQRTLLFAAVGEFIANVVLTLDPSFQFALWSLAHELLRGCIDAHSTVLDHEGELLG